MSEEMTIMVPDRTGWPPGPWDDEEDRYEWRDEATHLPCVARRSPLGAWCGYVGIPLGHPWHGLDWDDIEDATPVIVHGGLTYAAPCDPDMGVCHVPEVGESDDVWWVGFDCAHWMDLIPSLLAAEPRVSRGGTYRHIDYVRAECADLAAQVATAGHSL